MRFLLVVVFVCVAFSVKAGMRADTIPYWVIDYDKATIIRGNLNSPATPRHELTVKEDAIKNLIISFVYDSGQPETSSLVVKEKNETLRTIDHDPDMGPYFVVPVKELIGTHQTGVRYELDLYYSDDRGQKNLKLGTIIFNFK